MHQGRAQGADQAPLAAIARVSAVKSETWILVLCLRMYSMKGVLTRGTNEETGSQDGADVEWAVPHPPLMFSENCVHQRRRRNCRDGLHAQQKTQIHVDQG